MPSLTSSKEYRNSCCGMCCFSFFLAPNVRDEGNALSAQASSARANRDHIAAAYNSTEAAKKYSSIGETKLADKERAEAANDKQELYEEHHKCTIL